MRNDDEVIIPFDIILYRVDEQLIELNETFFHYFFLPVGDPVPASPDQTLKFAALYRNGSGNEIIFCQDPDNERGIANPIFKYRSFSIQAVPDLRHRRGCDTHYR